MPVDARMVAVGSSMVGERWRGAQESDLAVPLGSFCRSGASSGLWCPYRLARWAGDTPTREGAVIDRYCRGGAGRQRKALCQSGFCWLLPGHLLSRGLATLPDSAL